MRLYHIIPLFTPPPQPPGGHGTSQHLPTTRNFGRLGCKSFDWYLDNVATEVGLIGWSESMDLLSSMKMRHVCLRKTCFSWNYVVKASWFKGPSPLVCCRWNQHGLYCTWIGILHSCSLFLLGCLPGKDSIRFLDLLNLVVEGSLSHLVSPIVVVSFFWVSPIGYVSHVVCIRIHVYLCLKIGWLRQSPKWIQNNCWDFWWGV